jgi:hypothetical protein
VRGQRRKLSLEFKPKVPLVALRKDATMVEFVPCYPQHARNVLDTGAFARAVDNATPLTPHSVSIYLSANSVSMNRVTPNIELTKCSPVFKRV